MLLGKGADRPPFGCVMGGDRKHGADEKAEPGCHNYGFHDMI
jgi:hypothetical protein